MTDDFENNVMEEEQNMLNTAKDLHLIFRLENEDYAINVAEVSDILAYSEVRPVPKTPNYLKGIMNIRGDIIPVICVRTKFMKQQKAYDDETCIVKVQCEEYVLGLIVDKVIGVETITEAQITSPPNAKLNYANQFIKSIGRVENGVRMILSLEKLIF